MCIFYICSYVRACLRIFCTYILHWTWFYIICPGCCILFVNWRTPAYSVCLCVGDIRLVGGSDPSEGRVELFYEGEWWRVLQDNPPIAALADVACRQAGYPYSEGLQSFGQGSGPAWLEIFECTGDEERVEQCTHLGWRIILSISFDLSVRCRGKCGTRRTQMHTVTSCHINIAAIFLKLHTISHSLP